jgi:hypothetical protein
MIREEFLDKYPNKNDIPPERLGRFEFLRRSVSETLNRAYALGWRHNGDIAEEAIAKAAAGAPK